MSGVEILYENEYVHVVNNEVMNRATDFHIN